MSALLPTYARSDLAFARGRGRLSLYRVMASAISTSRSGVAVTALGHAHPHLVQGADRAGQEALACVQSASHPGAGAACRSGSCDATFADSRVLRQFRRRGGRVRDQGRAPLSFRGTARRSVIASSPSRAHSTAGRSRPSPPAARPSIWRASARRSMASTRSPPGDIAAVEAAIGDDHRRHPDRADHGRGRHARGVVARSCRICARSATTKGILLLLDEVQSGMGRTGRLFAHEWAGITPDIMATAKGLGGGFPVGACLTTEAVGSAMTAGSHGSTFGGNPLAMAVGNAVLDVVLAPGFLEHVAKMGLRLKQRLAALKDEHGDDHRGGARAGPHARPEMQGAEPGAAASASRRAAHAHGQAGDNVVRLLPPLIVGEAEIDLACDASSTPLASRSKCSALAHSLAGRQQNAMNAQALPRYRRLGPRRPCAPSSTRRPAMKRKSRARRRA